MRNRFRKKGWYNNAVAILIGVIGYVALTHLGTINESVSTFLGYLKPIILGCVIAYIVNPLASVLNRKVLNGIKRDSLRWGLSVALGMITVILLLSLLLLALIPQLVESIGLLLGNIDGYIASMQKLLQNLNIGGTQSKLGAGARSLVLPSEREEVASGGNYETSQSADA